MREITGRKQEIILVFHVSQLLADSFHNYYHVWTVRV